MVVLAVVVVGVGSGGEELEGRIGSDSVCGSGSWSV